MGKSSSTRLLAAPADAASAYGIERARVLRRLESYGNENWLVEDERRRRYVLRRQRLNASPERLGFQLALQRHLTAAGFPAATALETASGQPFARDADGTPWVLYRNLDGQEYDFARPRQAAAAGRCLARFHLIAQSFLSEVPGPDHRATIRHCWANAEPDIRELAHLLGGEADSEVAYLTAWWPSVLALWPLERLDALPAGTVHGDFHGRNLVFAGDEVVGVLDPDDVDRGPYAHDIAVGLVRFGRESRGSLRIRPLFARAFVEGYESARPLSPDERAALPILAAMMFPPHPKNFRYWRDAGGEDAVARFRREVATIAALRAEMERIETELLA